MKNKTPPAAKTWFKMAYRLKPMKGESQAHIRYPEAFVAKFLNDYTRPGDRVLDPFAGFGTTLIVAQRLKRVGIGIEYDEARCDFIRSKLRAPSMVIHGDARKIGSYDIRTCDFSLTSPPYMQRHHHENSLTNYTKAGDYKRYLAGLRKVYTQIKTVMKHDALIVLEVANIHGEGRPMTPLAWDVAAELSKVLFFERELIYCYGSQDAQSNTGSHSYCLLFRNR